MKSRKIKIKDNVKATYVNAKATYKDYCNVKLIECEEEVSENSLGESVLVNIEASTISLPGQKDEYFKPSIIVGHIVLIGTKIKNSNNDLKIGDRIVSIKKDLPYNSIYTTIPYTQLFKISSDSASLDGCDVVASLSSYYITIYQSLTRVITGIKAGDDILVVGNSDLYHAVQEIANVLGIYNVTKFRSKCWDKLARVKFDCVLDGIGDIEYCNSRQLLKLEGKLILINQKRSLQWNVFSNTLYKTYCYNEKESLERFKDHYYEDAKTILTLLQAQQIDPLIDEIVPLDDIKYAYEEIIEHDEGKTLHGNLLNIICVPENYKFRTEELVDDWKRNTSNSQSSSHDIGVIKACKMNSLNACNEFQCLITDHEDEYSAIIDNRSCFEDDSTFNGTLTTFNESEGINIQNPHEQIKEEEDKLITRHTDDELEKNCHQRNARVEFNSKYMRKPSPTKSLSSVTIGTDPLSSSASEISSSSSHKFREIIASFTNITRTEDEDRNSNDESDDKVTMEEEEEDDDVEGEVEEIRDEKDENRSKREKVQKECETDLGNMKVSISKKKRSNNSNRFSKKRSSSKFYKDMKKECEDEQSDDYTASIATIESNDSEVELLWTSTAAPLKKPSSSKKGKKLIGNWYKWKRSNSSSSNSSIWKKHDSDSSCNSSAAGSKSSSKRKKRVAVKLSRGITNSSRFLNTVDE